MKRVKLAVYEIEHGGDLEDAHEALRAAGARSVETVRADFEGAEAAVLVIGYEGDLGALKERAEEEGVCF